MLRQPNGRGAFQAVTRRDRELREAVPKLAACADPGREMPEAVLKLAACVNPGRELPEVVQRQAVCVDLGSRHPKTVQRLAVLVGMVRTTEQEAHRLQIKHLRAKLHVLQGNFRLQMRMQVPQMATPITARQAMPEPRAAGLPLRSRKAGLTQDPLSSRRGIFLQRRMNLKKYSSAHTAR